MRISYISRRLLLFLFLATGLVAFSACDSGGSNGEVLDGSYRFDRIRFNATGLNISINVLDSLDVARLELFGADNEFQLIYSFKGEEGRADIEGTYEFDGETVRFEVVEGEPAELLLPSGEDPGFELQVSQNGTRLSGGIEYDEEVDLSSFGIDQTLRGTLKLRLSSTPEQ